MYDVGASEGICGYSLIIWDKNFVAGKENQRVRAKIDMGDLMAKIQNNRPDIDEETLAELLEDLEIDSWYEHNYDNDDGDIDYVKEEISGYIEDIFDDEGIID